MAKNLLDSAVWQKVSVFTIYKKDKRVGAIFAERTQVKSGEYAGCDKVKCLVRLYDTSINNAVRPAPIRVEAYAVGYGYDLLTSAIGCAMQKTIHAKLFKAEAEGGGNLEEAFRKMRYTLDRII